MGILQMKIEGIEIEKGLEDKTTTAHGTPSFWIMHDAKKTLAGRRYFGTTEQLLEAIARAIVSGPDAWGITRDLEERERIRNKIHELADQNGLEMNKKFKYYSFEYIPFNS